MRLLLILLAATAFGQYEAVCRTPECGRVTLRLGEAVLPNYAIDFDGWPMQSVVCPCTIPQSGFNGMLSSCATVCFVRVSLPVERQYRIDWLRPDLDLRPVIDKLELGASSNAWGYGGFSNIYIYAPERSIIVILPSGKRVKITRAELNGRAK